MWAAVALGVGLAMDAMAVSAARGLAERARELVILPLLFGGFQAGMAALGWLAGASIGPYIAAWDRWVAFGLLVAIGSKMVIDAWRDRNEAEHAPRPPGATMYLGLAVATSIDAAAAGLTLPLVPVAPWISLVLIGGITAACSVIGYVAGRFVGSRFGTGLGIVGGLVLIGIGVRLLVREPGAPPVRDAASGAEVRVPEAAHVALPVSPATPPHRTTHALAPQELARLSALALPDFEREDRGTRDDAAVFRHTTRARPRLAVTVAIEHCPCLPMRLDAWTARRAQLRQSLGEPLAGRPDTRFDIGIRDLAGAPAIFTYQLGYVADTDPQGQPVRAYTDAYTVFYNDGLNQIRVIASYVDDAVDGTSQLVALAPEDDLEKLAVAFTSYYVHEWN